MSPSILIEKFTKAEKKIFWLTQKQSCTDTAVPNIKSLKLLEDKNQILRMKTNLVNRNNTENLRYPAILSCQHPVVKRLIFEKSIENQLVGVGVLMSAILKRLM